MADTIINPPFTGVHNFRDVGRVINSFSRSNLRIQEGLLFRSGRLDEITPLDAQLMIEKYHLKTVIDLRTKSEHLKRKEVLGLEGSGVRHWDTVKIHFIGRRFEINLIKQLKWWKAIWFILLMITGYRMAAIRIMGRNVMRPKGLIGLSKDSLQFCQSEIVQALEVYLNPQAYPVLVHCTQGKDRSGLVIMLILFILGVPVDLVKADYVLSNQGLERVRASMMDEVMEIGMDGRYLEAPEIVVDEVWKFVQEKGGVDVYLDEIGFGEDKRTKLRTLLLM
ncbi:protein-tyrosine phosphatase-like protein [Rhodocollybia butyracea]|uniref:Protein-tyrosine phosphatase-like protein n=1 Tax=Rhodocollybia butyracea TaxID=206335 RepID=A0A9P5PN83_9AGAR|nr:protein-tyrosine phosphatase-like protein [Rhodocollybia butyracea]